MDWVQLHCDRLRLKLQNVVGGEAHTAERPADRAGNLRVPWNWLCRSMIETVTKYPSGLTEAVILAELELLWRRDVRGALVPGKLQAYLDAQYAPLSDVVQARVVRHSEQLVTLVEDQCLTVVPCGQSPTKCRVDMYLHQNFKSCLRYIKGADHDLLAPGRKVRLTGCRLLTGATAAVTGSCGGGGGWQSSNSGARSSTLLLTEYVAFVLDHRRSEDLKLAASALGPTHVRDTFHDSFNHEAFVVVCKVVEIREPKQLDASAAGQQPIKRRQTLQTVVLECAARTKTGREKKEQQRQCRSGGRREAGTYGGDGFGTEGRIDGGSCSCSYNAETVVMHLWDEQTCLTSLFRKGDGLAVYWPWLVQKQSQNGEALDGSLLAGGEAASQQKFLSSQPTLPENASGWHFEYGSATTLFVLPKEGRTQLFAAANGISTNGNRHEVEMGRNCSMEDAAGNSASSGGDGGGGDGTSWSKPSHGVGGAGKRWSGGGEGGRGDMMRVQEMPADENGVRDLLQFSRRLFVLDLAPNLSNASIYGQVVSVGCVPDSSLPAILPPSRSAASDADSRSYDDHASFSQRLPMKPVAFLQQQQQNNKNDTNKKEHLPNGKSSAVGAGAAVEVVELRIRDETGTAKVLCCGHKAAADALRCRLGQYVLACGLRTFAAAFPHLDDSQGLGGDIVIICGEARESNREGDASTATAEGRRRRATEARAAGDSRGDGCLSRILNTSSLEGLLHCPFLSRHSLLCDKRQAPGPRSTFACKAAVTWARWKFDGDGLWAVHRRCGTRLPCHYKAICGKIADSAGNAPRKRPREMRAPGGVGSTVYVAPRDVSSVVCPMCKFPVRLTCADGAELAYASLLLALDDGTRCLVAECRSEIVTTALGGVNAQVFLQMGQVEREATLNSLIGREIRCVVGGDGVAEEGGPGSIDDCGGGELSSKRGSEGRSHEGRVELRVERIASVNPAADLAHLLSCR